MPSWVWAHVPVLLNFISIRITFGKITLACYEDSGFSRLNLMYVTSFILVFQFILVFHTFFPLMMGVESYVKTNGPKI